MENDKIYNLIEKMYSDLKGEISGLKDDMSGLKGDVNRIETKLDIFREETNKKFDTLVEVQQSFQEQLDRSKSEDGKTLGERLEIIELAVTKTSESVNDLVDIVDVVKETASSNDMDIKILKRLQKKHSL